MRTMLALLSVRILSLVFYQLFSVNQILRHILEQFHAIKRGSLQDNPPGTFSFFPATDLPVFHETVEVKKPGSS